MLEDHTERRDAPDSEALALLQILRLGCQQVEQQKLVPLDLAIEQIKARRRLGVKGCDLRRF